MANYTSVTASNICDAAGNKLASGTVSFQATDASNQPIPFQVGGGGQVVTTPAVFTITNGAIAGGAQVADSANTTPAGILYRIIITDTTLNRVVVTYSLVTVTGATFSLDTYSQTGAAVLPPTGGSVNGPLTVSGNLNVTGAAAAVDSTFSGSVSAKRIENVRYADQFSGADLGAKVNAAVADIGSGNAGTIIVPDGGGMLSTLVTLGKKHQLIFGSGTYNVSGIRLPDSSTDSTGVSGVFGQGPELTTLFLINGSNTDVVSNTTFATFTGGTNFYGTFRATIADLTIDGNKANNASGYGVRLYGRGYKLTNLVIQNAKNDGLWLEWGGTENDTSPTTDIESYVIHVETIYCGGNGFTHKGPNDVQVVNCKSYSNGAWGIDEFTSFHWLGINTYENTSGGIKIEATSGGGYGADVIGSTATGTGMLIASGAGACAFSASSFGGPIALEVDSPAHNIQGIVANSTTAGLKLNGGSGIFKLTAFNNTGPVVLFTSESGNSNIEIVGSYPVGGSLFSGTPNQADTVFVELSGSPNLFYCQLPSLTVHAGGWAPQLPQTNSVLVAPDKTNTWSANQTNMPLITPTIGGGTTLARYARYTPTLSPASVAANTTAEQTFTNVLTSGDVVVGVSKPTSQAGLGIVGWRASGTSLLITFSNNTGSPITPTASEVYQVVAVQ